MKKSLFIFVFSVFFACFLAGTCFASPDVPAVGQEEDDDAGYSGLSGKFGQDPKDQRVAMLLEEAKVLNASGNLDQVFSRMGKQKIGFKDLIEYKADHIGDMAAELRKGGMDGIEADRKATAIWNEKYQNIERRMIQERQNSVKKVWHAALMEYIRKNPNSPVFKGDIGGWATEPFEKMSFSSDIDFTLFFVDVDNAVELRDMFENKIKEHFGLDMRQFDAFCTAQRKAALDVYIGEWGAKWGEIDMIKRGKAEIWVNEDGQLKLKKVPAEDVLTMYHTMGETLTNDTFKPTADMEPGISMELYRHIEAEIIRGKFTTIDKIIKMCKYIDRSAVDHKAILGKTDGVDSKVAILARRVTEVKQTIKDPADMSRKVISLVDGFLGKGWADDPEKAIKDIADRGKHEMTDNINDAIKYHKDEAEKAGTEEEKAKKREWLEDVLKKEKAAYEHDNVKFPDEAKKTLDRYAGISEARSFFGDKADEYVKVMSDKKDGAKIAIASLISKAGQNMDLVNNYLDYLDNNTVQRLRDSDISIKVVEGRRVLYQVSLASINDSLNRSVLGKIGNNTAFKGFNLAEEGYAYFNAYVSAPTNEEGLKNLVNEVITRRVPGSGIAQAVVMENYVRAGIETAYLIFPPLAIPEAVVSLSYQVGSSGMSYGLGKFWESSLNEITDNIYAYSLFKPVLGSKGAEWKLTHLGYKGQKYSRDCIDKFFEAENRWVGAVFYKAVENDPVIVQLQKLMDNEYVGEKYRHKIEVLWASRHDECQKELLNKIIQKLEERMAAEMLGQGVGAERMKEIREALNCGMDTLVPESDNTEVNGEVYRAVMLDYQKHMDAVKKIDALSEKTGVKLNYYKPVCSLDSLRLASERNPELEGRYEAMIGEISRELKEIKGGFRWDDESDRKDMADLLEYRKLAEPDLSNESDLWQKKYAEVLKKIRGRYIATVEDIVITPEEEIFAGEELTFAAVLELDEQAGVTYSWEVSGEKYTDLTGEDSIQGGLKTVSDGTLTLDFKVIRDGKVIGERKEIVEILPVTLEGLRIEADGKDTLDENNTSVHLRAYATYSDGTESDITADAVWEVVSGENVGLGKGGVVSLAGTRSYTPSGDEKVRVKASYGDSAATVDIKVQRALSDLRSYWKIDPEYPVIPLNSDPRGIMVTFTAITDDPGNNDKRDFKWQFEKEDGSEKKTGQVVNVFYKGSGQYGILLTVTDGWGNEDEEHDTIVIEEEYPEEDRTEEERPDKEGQDEEKPFVT
ncbi:MAG: PKD domain-containing protein, partial [Candidatus Omnitrophota bacterium]